MVTIRNAVSGTVLSRYVGRLASNLRGTLDYWELLERFAIICLERCNLQVEQWAPSPSREDLF